MIKLVDPYLLGLSQPIDSTKIVGKEYHLTTEPVKQPLSQAEIDNASVLQYFPKKTIAGTAITYRQSFTTCGKKCKTCKQNRKHGPYWYAYYRIQKKLFSAYLGKNPDESTLARFKNRRGVKPD